jgi:hypothetical protein
MKVMWGSERLGKMLKYSTKEKPLARAQNGACKATRMEILFNRRSMTTMSLNDSKGKLNKMTAKSPILFGTVEILYS